MKQSSWLLKADLGQASRDVKYISIRLFAKQIIPLWSQETEDEKS